MFLSAFLIDDLLCLTLTRECERMSSDNGGLPRGPKRTWAKLWTGLANSDLGPARVMSVRLMRGRLVICPPVFGICHPSAICLPR